MGFSVFLWVFLGFFSSVQCEEQGGLAKKTEKYSLIDGIKSFFGFEILPTSENKIIPVHDLSKEEKAGDMGGVHTSMHILTSQHADTLSPKNLDTLPLHPDLQPLPESFSQNHSLKHVWDEWDGDDAPSGGNLDEENDAGEDDEKRDENSLKNKISVLP